MNFPRGVGFGQREGRAVGCACSARLYLVSGISGSKGRRHGQRWRRFCFRKCKRRGIRIRASCPRCSRPSKRDVGDDTAQFGADHDWVLSCRVCRSCGAVHRRGLLPAFVAALALVVVAWWRSRDSDAGAGERAPVSVMLRTLVIAIPGLSLPFVIRFTVIKGIRDGDRGVDRRRRLHRAAGPAGLSPVRLAAALPDPGRDRSR